MENKSNPGCGIAVAVVILLAAAGLFWFGNHLKNTAQVITDEEMELQNRLDALPVLTSDSEITAALNGTPQSLETRRLHLALVIISPTWTKTKKPHSRCV